MNEAFGDVDSALIARRKNLDLSRFQPRRKSRSSVELSFDDLAVIVKRLLGFGVQADGKLGGERESGHKSQRGKDGMPESGEKVSHYAVRCASSGS